MTPSRPIAVELAAQLALALAVGLSVSLLLAGATLLLAGHDAGDPPAGQPMTQARGVR